MVDVKQGPDIASETATAVLPRTPIGGPDQAEPVASLPETTEHEPRQTSVSAPARNGVSGEQPSAAPFSGEAPDPDLVTLLHRLTDIVGSTEARRDAVAITKKAPAAEHSSAANPTDAAQRDRPETPVPTTSDRTAPPLPILVTPAAADNPAPAPAKPKGATRTHWMASAMTAHEAREISEEVALERWLREPGEAFCQAFTKLPALPVNGVMPRAATGHTTSRSDAAQSPVLLPPARSGAAYADETVQPAIACRDTDKSGFDIAPRKTGALPPPLPDYFQAPQRTAEGAGSLFAPCVSPPSRFSESTHFENEMGQVPSFALGVEDYAPRAGGGLEEATAELLRPLLRQWLDDNMGRIMERALHAEARGRSRS